MTSTDPTQTTDALRGLAVLGGHIGGVVASATILGSVVLGDPRVLWAALTNAELAGLQAPHIAGHLLIAGIFWASAFGLGRAIWRRARGQHRPARVVSLKRGNVMTETLIVFPIALGLYLGLAQLAINNIAAALTNLATFQAARSMWVWAPEVEGRRSYTGLAGAADKARIQAAMAVAPVAAGDYIMSFTGLSEGAKMARAGLVAGQLPILTSDQGSLVTEPLLLALQIEDPGGLLRFHTRSNQNMAIGLDSTSFRLRSARKFTFAYLSIAVSPVERNGQVGARVIYSHFQSMPLVGGAFGFLATIGGRTGYYSMYQREMTLPKQYDANPRLP